MARGRSASTQQIGSIQVGKRGDLILIDATRPHLQPGPDPYSTIAYAARPGDVRMTMVDGEILVNDFAPTRMDEQEIVVGGAAGSDGPGPPGCAIILTGALTA